MPPRLSKFAVPCSCKEYVHPWVDSCISAATGLGLHTFQESLRLYSTVYLIAFMTRRKVPKGDDIRKMLLGILQSAAFLSWNGFAYAAYLCILRRLLGNFNILTVSFLPSFLASLMAILIERPSRRTLLCLYVSNIATETLFRMGVWRGYFSVLQKGEVYIFAISAALLLHLYRSKGNKEDSIFKIIRHVIGPYEEYRYQEKQMLQSSRSTEVLSDPMTSFINENQDLNSSKNSVFNAVWEGFRMYKDIIVWMKSQSKHPFCPHPYSCFHYVLMGSAKLFGYGVCAQLALKLVFQAKQLVRRPQLFKNVILRRENLYLATFLGGFPGIFRLTSCLLRRVFNGDSQFFAIPAGVLASIAFTMYPNNTIALYVMWKALQILWARGVESKKFPEVRWFVIFLYSFSTAILFHAAIIEPQNLRTSYWKFLHNISGGRIAAMARLPLDEFGLNTSSNVQDILRKTRTMDKLVYSF
ncbi:transmembrane protein 135 [Orussus abietinus]|uniref:transmembrane protein 135 n=1 Tax=Orussus abietinus TaxID=222816 RepID=UPI000625A5A2|nr:transmembrane protein 135 [Orussus abietinus]